MNKTKKDLLKITETILSKLLRLFHGHGFVVSDIGVKCIQKIDMRSLSFDILRNEFPRPMKAKCVYCNINEINLLEFVQYQIHIAIKDCFKSLL